MDGFYDKKNNSERALNKSPMEFLHRGFKYYFYSILYTLISRDDLSVHYLSE